MVYIKKGTRWVIRVRTALLILVITFFLHVGSAILGKDFMGKANDGKNIVSIYLRNYSILNKVKADTPDDGDSVYIPPSIVGQATCSSADAY